eukprot:PhF_6_TR8633/c0_g1_i1/m.13474
MDEHNSQSASVPKQKPPLVDRLKDCRMTGMWKPAAMLFRKAVVTGGIMRWQAFHFRLLVEILGRNGQWDDLRKAWEIVKTSQVVMDPQLANTWLNMAGLKKQPALVEDVFKEMKQRQFTMDKYGARGYILHLAREGLWMDALRTMHDEETRQHGEYTPCNLEYGEIIQSCGDRNFATQFIASKGIPTDPYPPEIGNALLHMRSSWLDAIEQMTSGVHKMAPNTTTMNTLLAACSKGSHSPRVVQQVYDYFASRYPEIQPNTKTYELLTSRFARSGNWLRAIELFEDSQRKGVPTSTDLYNNVFEALSRGGQPKSVMETYMKMNKDGFQGNLSSTLHLINAYSRHKKR